MKNFRHWTNGDDVIHWDKKRQGEGRFEESFWCLWEPFTG